MMKEKYYQPDISEFHVGFEYEYNGKCIFTNDMSIAFMDYLITNGKIIVKYLDKEDIENLGVENIEVKDVMLHCAKNAPDNSEDLLYSYFLDYNTETHKLKVSLLEDILFEGTIKNKSELKRILKQIGV